MKLAQKTKVYSSLIITLREWNLSSPKDSLLIGVSGGKDSLALLDCLYQAGFTNLHSIHIQIDESSELPFIDFCRQRSNFTLIKTNILADLHKHNRKNICYMCSRAKRKAICTFALENGFTKIALAHHKNDVIETMLLNLIFQREISTMMPRQDLFNGKLELIRPFYATNERDIIRYCKDFHIHVSQWKCGFETQNLRAWTKEQIKLWQKSYPKLNIKENLFKSILNVNPDFIPCKPKIKI